MRKNVLINRMLLVALISTVCANGCSKRNDRPEPGSMPSQSEVPPVSPQKKSVGDLATEALAKDQNVAVDQIEVESVQAIDWPDSSLGCGKPGEMYMQVITPGHKVTLRIGTKLFYVHEAKGRTIVCGRAIPSRTLPQQ